MAQRLIKTNAPDWGRPLRASFLAWVMAVGALASGATFAASLDEVVQQGRQLIGKGDNSQAFEVLQAEEMSFAGSPEFDYWLGVAAVRSGKASLGLLALDRLLLIQPNHAGGRLERAFALIQLGMLDQADEELNQLQTLNPPKKAAGVIQQYRSAIAKKRHQENSPSHLFTLGAGAGYDSNVNSAPSDYVLELFDGLFQSRISNEASTFGDLRLQYVGLVPVDKVNSMQFVLSGQSRQYANSSLDAYSLGLIQGQVNWRYSPSADLVINSRGELVRVYSGSPYEGLFTQYGLRSAVDIPVLLESRLELAGGWKTQGYDAATANDLDALTLEAGLKMPLNSQWQLQSQLTYEYEAAGERDGGDASRVKALLGVDYKHNPSHKMRFAVNGQWVDYKEKGFALYNDFVAVSRQDQSLQGSAEWTWIMSPELSLSTQGSYRQQTASLDFFEYSQFSVSSNLTYLWR